VRRLKGLSTASIGLRNALKDHSDADRNINLAISHPIRDLAEFPPGIRFKLNIQLKCLTLASIPQRPRMQKDSAQTTHWAESHVGHFPIRIKPRPTIAFAVAELARTITQRENTRGNLGAILTNTSRPSGSPSNFLAQPSSKPTGEPAPCLSYTPAESNNGAIS
jgi:hypothetical protein